MTPHALDASAVSKRFGRHLALDQVDLAVPQGRLVVVLGAAGAGKTTLLRIIAGLTRPDAGQVRICGQDATYAQPKDRDIAMIFDNLALFPDRTGFANIAHPLLVRRLPASEIEQRVKQVAGTLRISHVLSRLPRTMSGGERQRVALGRALVRAPRLFLLDEPLSSLDAMLRFDLRAELRRLQREHGYPFLMATPDHAEAMAIADTLVMLVRGEVRQVAPPQTVYDAPADRDVARFVGAPEINLLPADYDPDEGGRIRLAGMIAPATDAMRRAFGRAPTRFEAGLRPEHVALADTATEARVIDVERLGLKATVTVRLGNETLRAVASATQASRVGVGDAVGFVADLERMVCFDQASGQRLL